jgi:hypothetical protein
MIIENDDSIFWVPIEEATSIQSLIFSKDSFDKASAKAWAKKHNFKSDVDEKEDTYRMRQQNPKKFARMRTKSFGEGIKAIIGVP